MTTPEEKDAISEVCREDADERSQHVGSIHQTPYGSISHYPAVAVIVTSDPREMQVKAPDARIGSVLMHGYDFKPVPTKFSEILALPDINELRQQLADVSHELLPCPYCGRSARYVAEDYVDNSGEPWPFAECDACNTGAPVEFWNKRAQPADQQGEPVAWLINWFDDGSTYCITENKLRADRLIADSDFVVTPLYSNAQPATAKVDENAEFSKWRDEQCSSLERMGYPDAAKKFSELGSIHWAGWQARAKLNGGQS